MRLPAFVLQGKRFICAEVLALTDNSSVSCYILQCITLVGLIPLEVSIGSIVNTDCLALAVSAAPQLLIPLSRTEEDGFSRVSLLLSLHIEEEKNLHLKAL